MPIDTKKDNLETAIQKLKAKENNFSHLGAIFDIGSWEVDLQTHESIWSDRTYKIYGYDKEHVVPTLELFLSHVLPEHLLSVEQKIQEGIASKKVTSLTCKVQKTSGEIITVSLHGQAIFNEDGTLKKLIGTTQDITQDLKKEQRAQELYQLIEHSSNEIYIISTDTLDYQYVNKGSSQALGYTSEELLKMNVRDINPFLTESEIAKLQAKLSSETFTLNKAIHKRKDGSHYHVQSYIHTLNYMGKNCYAIFDIDISQLIELKNQYEKQAKILEYIHDSVISTDTRGIITSWNRGSTLLFDYDADEMIGKSIHTIYPISNQHSVEELFKILIKQGNFDIEVYMLTKKNEKIICNISLSVSKDEYGNIDGYIGYLQDISAQKETQKLLEMQTQKLKYQAHHDSLTDLPNRTLFKDRLSQSIINSKRNHTKFALLFIDLDQFKKINDSLGHHIGDEVLVETAKRISSIIREDDSLARLGGDEFTIILKNITSIQSASFVAQKIIEIMLEPIIINDHNLYVTSSIGISVYPDDATTDLDLIKYADTAMYKAKDEGRSNYQFYSSSMTAFAFEHVVMESSLRIAIKEEQFLVYFQPQYTADSGIIIGMEALVRWRHPKLGLIPPSKFIPIAEETRLIIEIDKIVMKKAMAQFSLWHKKGYNPGVLSLNLAMKQLNEKNFLSHLEESMHSLDFKAEWLELEVTERQVMKNPEAATEKLNSIHSIGIEIAIDDFGTGYSSLSYLKKLPLDTLKIDQSFIRDIPEDTDDMAITKAIIALGKSLNLKLIAEGVETQAQKDFVHESGCDTIQGYYYSPPIPAEEIEELLQIN